METTELMHYGVKGMRWGHRKKYYGVGTNGFAGEKPKLRGVTSGPISGDKHKLRGATSGPSNSKSKIEAAQKRIKNSKSGREILSRGKSAIDVLINGDKDWMGHSTVSDNSVTEVKNRGKAALERLLYSEEQIRNKKFFGEYNPFG